MERQGWVVSVAHIDLMGVMMSHKYRTGRKNLYRSMSVKQQKKWHRKLSKKGNLIHTIKPVLSGHSKIDKQRS